MESDVPMELDFPAESDVPVESNNIPRGQLSQWNQRIFLRGVYSSWSVFPGGENSQRREFDVEEKDKLQRKIRRRNPSKWRNPSMGRNQRKRKVSQLVEESQ